MTPTYEDMIDAAQQVAATETRHANAIAALAAAEADRDEIHRRVIDADG